MIGGFKMNTYVSKGNSKIGTIPNVSLPPVISCGNCSACASKCYAKRPYRRFKTVKKYWDNNLKLARDNQPLFFQGIRDHLKNNVTVSFFRWHVSGDILNQKYVNNMVKLARDFPHVKFLAFTKMFDLDYSARPNNLQIVFSMFPTMLIPKKPKNVHFSWVQDGTETRMPKNAIHCPGSCEACGMCWSLSSINRDVYFDIH
jgi:ferredoxin